MAIVQDGSQKFGITTASFAGLIVENFESNNTGERVDLNDGDGLPLGSTVIPGRVEFSATLQFGASGPVPTIGSAISYGSDNWIVVNASKAETQGDYQRVNVSGYKKIN